jgi:2-keto-3-deoxy-L-rhamnonate aldolase RhmA
MRENTLKHRLYAGQAAFGVILLDNEHGSINIDTAEACVAAELTGMAPIVRPVGNKPEIIAPFLDREVEAIDNLPELVTVPAADVYFIGAGDLSNRWATPGSRRIRTFRT